MSGEITLPTAFDPLAWHRHEMLFGYLGGVIGGFLLTAIPNWTGRPPFAGAPLAAIAALWLAARLAVLFSAEVGAGLAFILDIAFLLTLCTVAAREVIRAKNRNKPTVLVILLFAIACGLDHGEANGLFDLGGAGWRGGFAIVLVLIALIGGRIIPAFTRNWLMKQGVSKGLPVQANRFDLLSIGVLALALAIWTVLPDNGATGLLLVLAGLIQAARLARWSGWRTFSDKLVFILHLSYAWLPIGLLLLGASLLGAAIPATAALHALAAGAMASMTLAVMTRATLGHTGRPLHADGWTVAIYALVTAGAALRVAAPLLPFDYMHEIELAGLLWGAAFLLFLLSYGPKLLTSRVDGG